MTDLPVTAAVRHLIQTELAARWRISPRSLERWRANGTGPAWLRVGGRVVYPAEDVEHFERQHRRPGGDR